MDSKCNTSAAFSPGGICFKAVNIKQTNKRDVECLEFVGLVQSYYAYQVLVVYFLFVVTTLRFFTLILCSFVFTSGKS